MMKKLALFLSFLLLFNLSSLCFVNTLVFANNQDPNASLDRMVAVVNNQIITKSELLSEELAFKKQMDPNSELAKLAPMALRQKILTQLIDEALQLQLAEQRDITVSEKALDIALSDIAARNKLSLSAFRDGIEAHGLGYRYFREHIRKEMVLLRLQQLAIGNSLDVSNQEVDAFLKKEKVTQQQARNLLYERKLKLQLALWLEKLRAAAYIKIML